MARKAYQEKRSNHRFDPICKPADQIRFRVSAIILDEIYEDRYHWLKTLFRLSVSFTNNTFLDLNKYQPNRNMASEYRQSDVICLRGTQQTHDVEMTSY